MFFSNFETTTGKLSSRRIDWYIGLTLGAKKRIRNPATKNGPFSATTRLHSYLLSTGYLARSVPADLKRRPGTLGRGSGYTATLSRIDYIQWRIYCAVAYVTNVESAAVTQRISYMRGSRVAELAVVPTLFSDACVHMRW